MTDPRVYEALVLYAAYCELHTHLLSTDPRTSDPHDLHGPLCMFGVAHAACRLRHLTANAREAVDVVFLLLELTKNGRRPRYGSEMNLTVEHFISTRQGEGDA